MKKLFKSRKALSPVVAAIILIAVTVAVSIAVAAWMGALTFTFMQTEELKILSHTWGASPNPGSITLTVKNTGSSSLTLSDVLVNDASVGSSNWSPSSSATITAGGSETISITYNFTSGTKYEFAVLTAGGNKYNYVTTAP